MYSVYILLLRKLGNTKHISKMKVALFCTFLFLLRMSHGVIFDLVLKSDCSNKSQAGCLRIAGVAAPKIDFHSLFSL